MGARRFPGWAWPLLSGWALFLSFPNFSLFPLAWVALMPYLYFLLQERRWRQVIGGHFLMASLYFGGVLYWIPRVLVCYGNLAWPLALVVFSLMVLGLGLLLFPFSILTRWVASKSPRLALFCAPGFLVATELARNYYALKGFPWALLGHSQFPYRWLVQIADLGGVYLISFLVVLGNSALLFTLLFRQWKPVLIFGTVLLMANLYGIYRLHLWHPDLGESLKIALVQGNIGLGKDREHYAQKYFQTLPAYYREAAAGGAQWVIFPEAPNPYFYLEDIDFKTFWKGQLEKGGAYLLINSTYLEEGSSRYFNSAFLLDPRGEPIYRYDKVHLVPFGEYVPAGEWLSFLVPLVQEVAGFTPGESIHVGQVEQTRFATLICYEGIFPELSRESVRRGAEILVNMTNDSWYGRSAAPRQHIQNTAFRAIETRKPILRCANSGYSALIDPGGEILYELDLFQEGKMTFDVAGNFYRPIYSYVGEWLNILIVCVSFILAFRGRFLGV